MSLSEADLLTAKMLCKHATPGPWQVRGEAISDTFEWESAKTEEKQAHIWIGPQNWYIRPADLKFIQGASWLMPLLVEEIERLRRQGTPYGD